MRLLRLMSILSLLVGIACLVGFSFLGGDELYNGAIHEPFYLIIFGVGLLLISLFLIVIDTILLFFDRRKHGS